jgi:hypothetical protein
VALRAGLGERQRVGDDELVALHLGITQSARDRVQLTEVVRSGRQLHHALMIEHIDGFDTFGATQLSQHLVRTMRRLLLGRRRLSGRC